MRALFMDIVVPSVDQELADSLWAAQIAAQNELPAKLHRAVHNAVLTTLNQC